MVGGEGSEFAVVGSLKGSGIKEQGTRNKEQGTRFKDKGSRSKVKDGGEL